MAKFTKIQLVEEISLYETIESKAEAGRILEHIKSIIKRELLAGNDVALGTDFGEFYVTTQAARSGIALGVPYTSPAKSVVKFGVSSPLKALIAGN